MVVQKSLGMPHTDVLMGKVPLRREKILEVTLLDRSLKANSVFFRKEVKICITLVQLLTWLLLPQPNYEFLDKEVEKRKMALQEAKLKAKGLNPDGTPALSTLGGFSPASKPCKLVF